MDSKKKYDQMVEDGEINPNKILKAVGLLTDDIAREEWEEYYEYNKDVLYNSEDFEISYGFVIWLQNKNLI
tara:strand:- start:991 stop:1203 length:213 start_codon:yes stop_codon:yes gene_type:complete